MLQTCTSRQVVDRRRLKDKLPSQSETILPHNHAPDMAEKLGIGPKPEFHGTDGRSSPLDVST